MDCLKCNTVNSDEAKFCKNCGTDLYYATPVINNGNLEQSLKYVLIVFGWHYVGFVIWTFINAVVAKYYRENNATGIGDLYKYTEWFISGTTILLLLVFALIVKNKLARVCFSIFLFIRILMTFSYLLMR